MKFFVLLAMMGNLFSASCTQGKAAPLPALLPAATYLNVAYGADARQVMDIYLPAGRTSASTKVMLLLHGGSWSGGDKSSFTGYVDSMRKRLPDYAFININYRLATYTTNQFPAQENDVKAAVEFIVRKSADYAVSKEFVLLGASAGAHLALLHAYKYTDPVKIKAIVSFFGPSDINDMYEHPVHPQVPLLLQLLMGGTPESNAANYRASSPVNFVTPESCPTLLFQGEKDMLVNPRQAKALRDKLQSAGVPNELVLYPNEGHGWTGATLSSSFDKIRDFLQKWVQ
ncbi:MAG: alpha/beta hydrolase [Williamsia sp.]|nr:alpha/beta hydrolase [Williamsia sp.]